MASTLSLAVERSASLEQARESFLDRVEDWALSVVNQTGGAYVSDSHDGGTFMTPWSVLFAAREVPQARDFFRRYRDAAKAHFESTGQWFHGYWKQQEAHHGTEHFDIYLRTLWQVEPEDPIAADQMVDAAEHVLNRVPEVPAWYDIERDLFLSFWLGAEKIGPPGPDRAEHLRYISLALHVHDMIGSVDYLQLAARYGAGWADAILNGPNLPKALADDGPVYGQPVEPAAEADYHNTMGAAPADLSTELKRAENLLANDACGTMLRLWRKTGVMHFRLAAERILDATLEVLADPVAWQLHGGLARHRNITGSTRYDEAIAAVPEEQLRDVNELTMDPAARHPRQDFRLGRRHDMPTFLDQTGREAPSPLLMMLAGRVTDNVDLQRRGLDVGRAMFELARRAYGDIAGHGCTSRALHSIARGHGRRNGCGVVTEVLGPAVNDVCEM